MRALETLVLASIWAPLSRRSRTMITLPRLDAMCRGVIPFCRTDTDELRQKTKRTESKSCDWPSVTISFPLPLGWSWHWLLYWAAVELRSSFHSAQQCGGVWIQSAGTHKVNTMLLSFPLHLRNKQQKQTNYRHSCSILYTHTHTLLSTSGLGSFCRSTAAVRVSSLRAAMCSAGRRTFPLVP